LAREARDALDAFVVESVGIVAGAVVVVVQVGEERQGRHSLGVESGGVGREVGVVLQDQVEARGDVAAFDQPAPHRR
jgi:hypothetical protein